jgi:hypothetical protein
MSAMSESSRFEVVLSAAARQTWPLWVAVIVVFIAWRQLAGEPPAAIYQTAIGIVPIGVTIAVVAREARTPHRSGMYDS